MEGAADEATASPAARAAASVDQSAAGLAAATPLAATTLDAASPAAGSVRAPAVGAQEAARQAEAAPSPVRSRVRPDTVKARIARAREARETREAESEAHHWHDGHADAEDSGDDALRVDAPHHRAAAEPSELHCAAAPSELEELRVLLRSREEGEAAAQAEVRALEAQIKAQ
eukprot:5716018-Prymnesium_polylepis.5